MSLALDSLSFREPSEADARRRPCGSGAKEATSLRSLVATTSASPAFQPTKKATLALLLAGLESSIMPIGGLPLLWTRLLRLIGSRMQQALPSERAQPDAYAQMGPKALL